MTIGLAWLADLDRRQRPSAAGRAGRAARRRPASRPRRRRTASAADCTRSRMNGIWFFASFASVKQNCEQALVDELARRPREHVDALLTPAGVGEQDVAGAPAGRRPEAHARERRGLDAERRPALGAPSSSKRRFGLSSHSRSSPFTLKTSTRRFAAPSPTHAAAMAGQHAEEEQRERGLRRDAADAADRHVAALAPVEEVEVDVHRRAVAAEPDRQRPLHLVGVQRLRAFVAGGAIAPPRRGRAETQISGSTRVTATVADRTFGAGMIPSSAMRCVSDS